MHGDGEITATTFLTIGIKVGYTRVSTNDQDLAVQRKALSTLRVEEKKIFVDHELTGANRVHSGLPEARASDTLVVTKLDRLALFSS
ncbi:hypothetical protein StoSoilB20_10200 [Arthrobacter sp. StoSoilB20]|nr:hypothetical protein StoSoilB20_10200 [Arthrobacter sp. StoSoilB20]